MNSVLIVDDNLENRYLLRCLLEADGFEVSEAQDGRQALELARGGKRGLIISDILMPVMDGFTLCRECKSDPCLRNVPFIFYTATYTDQKDEKFARSLGADLFIVKPVEPESLREQIRAVVAKQRSGSLPHGDFVPVGAVPYLKEYSEILVRKLESKVLELEATNHALWIKDAALESAHSGIVIIDPVGSVTYANPAALRMMGMLVETLVGRLLCDVMVLPLDWNLWLLSGAEERHFEVALPGTLEAGTVWVQADVHAVKGADGKLLGFMLSCVDVSKERRLREQLSRIQRLESLGLFAAGVAHDFNNVLMSVFTSVELASLPGITEVERQKYRATAMVGFERARELTRRLQSFSRGGASEHKPIDVRQVLDESVALALGGSAVFCERHYDERLPSVLGDSGQLAQVFGNLLVNARQAMKDEGRIALHVETAFGAIGGDGAKVEEFVVVRMSDDGPGIALLDLPNVFEPYFTTKPEGTGLGLATSQAIVREHGGTINVSSVLGEGATFEIRLPGSSQMAERTKSVVVPSMAPSSGRILVMDDESIVRGLVERVLVRAGYQVVAVADGEQALGELRRARDEGSNFDLVILDVMIEDGMGGVETLAEMRKSAPHMPVIFSTGHSDRNIVENLCASGAAHVLSKPFAMHELLSTVKASIEETRLSGS
jgi:two-component system, cell cycle sensor histidine kinase and response regulator CckA